MTTYLDVQGLAPTPDLARAYANVLGLNGVLVPEESRTWLLLAGLSEGDEVLTGPTELDFWMLAHPSVGVRVVPDGRELDRKKRAGSVLEWRLRLLGMTPAQSKAWVKKPPTERHSKHHIYKVARDQTADLEFAEVDSTPLGEDPERIGVEPSYDIPGFEWKLVTDTLVLGELIDRLADANARAQVIGIDVEADTPGKDPDPRADVLMGIGFSFGLKHNYYVPLNGAVNRETVLASLLKSAPTTRWIGWNAIYDALVSRRAGFPIPPAVGDGMAAATLLQRQGRGLKQTVHELFGILMETFEDLLVVTGAKQVSEVPPERAGRYCCADAYLGREATVELENRLTADPGDGVHKGMTLIKMYHNIEMKLHAVLVKMTEAGLPIDVTGVLHRHHQNERSIKEIRDVLAEQAGRPDFNPGSPDQVVELLHTKKGLPIQGYTATGAPSVKALNLLRMKDHDPLLIRLLLLDRHYGKENGTYLGPWLAKHVKGRLITLWNQYLVNSGRLSSEDPNLMNLPLDLREFVVGDFIIADYSQLEMRIAAWISREPALIKVYQEGGDVHDETCQRVFGVPRKSDYGLNVASKAINFAGMLYGAGGYKVVELIEKQALENPELHINIPSTSEANGWLGEAQKAYPRYYAWKEYILQFTRDRGYSVDAYGRRRVIPDINSPDTERRMAAEREAVNHAIQGTAATIVKMAMVLVDDIPGGRILLQNHDEILSELLVKEAALDYAEEMEKRMLLGQPLAAGTWGVPLEATPVLVGNWKEAK